MHPNLNRGIHIEPTNNEVETFFGRSQQESKLKFKFSGFYRTDCSDCGHLGCDTIYCCTWTPTFFRVKVSWVKNIVKLSHATK
jgi:hypothetical protein